MLYPFSMHNRAKILRNQCRARCRCHWSVDVRGWGIRFGRTGETFLQRLIKTDSMEPRPDTPRPTMDNLRTPSYIYNHGGYYAPSDPKTCNLYGGPCSSCQERIEEQEAAETILLLAKSPKSPPCCADRPSFMEPCPDCNSVGTYVTHVSQGVKTCNGCDDKVCLRCFEGARYYCPLRKRDLPPPDCLERQIALGVQSPKVEEKTNNKK